MAQLRDLITHLDGLLRVTAFADYGPNGLQVPGRDEVDTVVTGVSAHVELLDRAAEEDAGLLLVHHGLFWRGQPLEIGPAMHRRLRVLFDHDMALAAYHLPLDGHPEHGNNALLADALGCVAKEPCFAHDGRPLHGSMHRGFRFLRQIIGPTFRNVADIRLDLCHAYGVFRSLMLSSQ